MYVCGGCTKALKKLRMHLSWFLLFFRLVDRQEYVLSEETITRISNFRLHVEVLHMLFHQRVQQECTQKEYTHPSYIFTKKRCYQLLSAELARKALWIWGDTLVPHRQTLIEGTDWGKDRWLSLYSTHSLVSLIIDRTCEMKSVIYCEVIPNSGIDWIRSWLRTLSLIWALWQNVALI